jgi:hypothetical protein
MFVFRSCFCEGDARKLLILNWLGIALQFYRQIKPKKSLRLESAGEGWFEFDGLEVTDSAPNTKAGLKAESFLRKRLILASNRPLNGRIKVFPEIREQRSEIRGQRPETRDQRSGVRDQFVQRSSDFLYCATAEGYFLQAPAVRPAAFGRRLPHGFISWEGMLAIR